MRDRLFATLSSVAAAGAIVYGVHLGRDDVASARSFGPARPRAIAPRAAKPVPADAQEVSFDTLVSYEYRPGLEGLPDSLKALDGRKVVMHGFLLPLYEWDDIREFGLVANHMSCCFGMPPGINGQVFVKLSGKEGLPNTSEPLRVVGTFRVKEIQESGFVLAIYAIEDAEAVIVGY
jgi:hypothetical protein